MRLDSIPTRYASFDSALTRYAQDERDLYSPFVVSVAIRNADREVEPCASR